MKDWPNIYTPLINAEPSLTRPKAGFKLVDNINITNQGHDLDKFYDSILPFSENW